MLQEHAWDKAVVLFDGVCNLCNAWVVRIIRNDRRDHFRFASLQSDIGQQLLRRYQIQIAPEPESVLLIDSGRVYKYSAAALRIAGKLSGGYRLLYPLLAIPAFLRDAVYRLIARNRYRWWGRRQSCMMPSESLRSKFL